MNIRISILVLLFVVTELVHAVQPTISVNNGEVTVFDWVPGESMDESNQHLKVKYDISADYYQKNPNFNYQEYYKRIDQINLVGNCLLVVDGGHGTASHSGYSGQIDSWTFDKKKYSLKIGMPVTLHRNAGNKWAVLAHEAEGDIYGLILLKESCELQQLKVEASLRGYPVKKLSNEIIFSGKNKSLKVNKDGEIELTNAK